MSNKIIDFNEHRQRKGGQTPGEEFSVDDLMENLDSLPDNELMSSVANYVNEHMIRLLGLMNVGKRVTELLTSIGLDPDQFSIDVESADRFLNLESFDISESPFNGPFFDWYDDEALVRVVTAFHEEDDNTNLLIAVMKLEDGADHWQRYGEDGWVDDGPPADIFDALDDWDDEDWDDEDDEDWDDDEPISDWDEEYEASVYALYLSPQTYRALARAGVDTIQRLSQMTDLELLAIEGIGPKELDIIRKALEDIGEEAGE